MNMPRFLMAAVAVFIVMGVVQGGSHALIITDQINAVMLGFNLRAEPHWSVWASRVVLTLVFCFVFLKGYEGKGVAEGARYGALIGLFFVASGMALYGLVDVGFSAAVAVMVVDYIAWVASGAVLALVYKPADAQSEGL